MVCSLFFFFFRKQNEGFDFLHVNEISFDVIFFLFFVFRNDSNIAFRFYGALLNFPRCIIALIKCRPEAVGFE